MAESRRRECHTYSNQLSDSGGCVCPGRVSCGFDFGWREGACEEGRGLQGLSGNTRELDFLLHVCPVTVILRLFVPPLHLKRLLQ
jgi:hypothetical protein